MSTTSLAAMAAALLVGCSWVYDADDLRGQRDGGPGAGPDADPDALHVFDVLPGGYVERELLEGEGSSAIEDDAAEGVRAIPIVLDGQNMTADTVFTVSGAGLDDGEVEATVSADGHWAAFEVRLPLDVDEPAPLKIDLRKGEETFTPRLVVVQDLTALEKDGGAIDTDDLEAYYTNVLLTGVVTATGDAPLRLYATAGMQIDGTLRANGNDQDPGPGGCAGGDSGAAAMCGDGSGGGDSLSGGGGGFGTAGTEGADGGGAAGDEAGEAYVVPLPPAEGAVTGGGGGGGGGVAGGGSGGVIELTSPAIVSFGSGVVVSANGGDGVAGTVVPCTTSGNGGGGSGGAILVRAGAAILAAVDARIEALGGAGGSGGSTCDGGDGGDGKIRIDGPGEELPNLEPGAYHGPAFAAPIPPITEEASLTLVLRGRNDTDYEVIVNGGGSPTVISTDGSGTGDGDVSLEPGLNRLCVRVSPAADLTYPESKNCATVAYIPQ